MTLVVILLVFLGIVHFYWALGGKRGVDKAIPTIDGKPTMEPGAVVTAFVGFALIGIGGITFALGFFDLKSVIFGKYIIYSGWLLSGIFIIRSVGDFKTVGFFKQVKESNFAKYDTLYYSPLCLLLGVLFLNLSYRHT